MRGWTYILWVTVVGCGAGPQPEPPPTTPTPIEPGAQQPPEEPAAQRPRPRPETLPVADPRRYAVPEGDLEAQIAWARTQWPDELDDLHFEDHSDDLRAWVRPGRELRVYANHVDDVGGEPCAPAVLTRAPREEERQEEADTAASLESDGYHAVALRVRFNLREERDDDGRRRMWTDGSAGFAIRAGGGGGSERFERGRWVEESATVRGTGDGPDPAPTLTEVDRRIARFAGIAMELSVRCGMTTAEVSCDSGGVRSCYDCQGLDLVAQQRDVIHGPGGVAPPLRAFVRGEPRPPPCDEPCPHYVHPDRDALNAFFRGLPIWRMRDSEAPVPSLYRSRRQCLAEQAEWEHLNPPDANGDVGQSDGEPDTDSPSGSE